MVGLGASMTAAVAAVAVTGEPVADGRSPGIELVWDAPEACPGVEDVRARIVQRLEDDAGERRDVRANARVERVGDSFVLWLRLDDARGPGARRLEADACGELADAAALIVAIAVDPRLALGGSVHIPEAPPPALEPEPAPAPDRDPVPEPVAEPREAGSLAPENPQPEVTTPRPRRRPGYGVRALGGVDVNVLSNVGGVVALGFALRGARWRAELAGSYWTPRTLEAPDTDGIRGTFQMWSVGVRGGWVPRVGVVEFPLTVAVELGAAHGNGGGDSLIGRRATGFWAGLAGGPALAIRVIPRIALWLQVDGVWSLRRPLFETDLGTEVHTIGAGGARVVGGLEVRWP